MHGDKGCESPHKVKNIYAEEDRPIFLISDVPHLLKTTQNSWANSHAHANTRYLWVRTYYLLHSSISLNNIWCLHTQNNGQEISWQHMQQLFERHCTMRHSAPGLSLLHKLKYEHLHLTSYSKMRVDLAVQVRFS